TTISTSPSFLKRALERIHRDASRALGVDALTGQRIHLRNDLVRLGSKYGGWIVPAAAVREDSVCYCVGVGEDISFDLALMEHFGCEVHAFDPTPRAIEFVRKNAAELRRFHFHPLGVWDRDELLRFYAPSNPAHVSHSVMNLQQTDSYFEAPCRSLTSLMEELGHARIDLLKLDVEGAEHRVIAAMLEHAVTAKVLCVEFDEATMELTPESRQRIVTTAAALASHGYLLVAQEGRSNYTFMRRE
ncbi:MAG TPA: FkbM family methyltransferase, partial [Steroidobacter sp.]|nr:FkbM family methyltransferase [Steroidobacter sp.]